MTSERNQDNPKGMLGRGLASAGVFLLWVFSSTLGAGEERYQLLGRLLTAEGRPFRDVVPTVFLQSATRPFSKRTQVGPGGAFKFKKLPTGIYHLSCRVPNRGETRRTVVVGPTFADAKRRVHTVIRFEAGKEAPREMTVSAEELAISPEARRHYRKAQQRLSSEDVDGAVSELVKAVERAPSFADAWNQLGTIAYQAGDYPQAEAHFRQALEKEPDSYPPLVNLGGALLSQGRIAEALPYNLRALEARPEDALAHAQVGQNYFHLKRLDQAETHLKEAKKLDPRHFSLPRLFLAEIYRSRGNEAARVRELEEFITQHPDHPMAVRVRLLLDR